MYNFYPKYNTLSWNLGFLPNWKIQFVNNKFRLCDWLNNKSPVFLYLADVEITNLYIFIPVWMWVLFFHRYFCNISNLDSLDRGAPPHLNEPKLKEKFLSVRSSVHP